jgi:hypothetical protein
MELSQPVYLVIEDSQILLTVAVELRQSAAIQHLQSQLR